MKKIHLILIGLAVLVVAAGFGYAKFLPGAAVDVAAARVALIREMIDETAKTRLPEVRLITMPYAARIDPIALAEGDYVTKDKVVARIVEEDMKLQLAQAKAAVDRLHAAWEENQDTSVEGTSLKQTLKFVESMASTVSAARERVKSGKAKLDYAESNLERTVKLRPSGAKSVDDEERARLLVVETEASYRQDQLILAAVEATQAATALMPVMVTQYISRKTDKTGEVLAKQKDEATAAYKKAELDWNRGKMTSPVDGVVLERYDSNERYVPAGTVLLRIGELDRIEIESEVLTEDVGDVKPGNPAEVYGSAVGATPAKATVQRVYPAGFTKVSSLGVEQQRVKVILKFTPEELKRLRSQQALGVEYRVRVRMFTASKQNALVIPRAALFRSPKGQWQVFAIRGDQAELREVKVGLLNDELAEITEGLADGEDVVLAPESSLADGARVKPTRRE